MAFISDEENEALKRDLAERILLGEYDSAVVLLVTTEGKRRFWTDGQQASVVGLLELAKHHIVQADIDADD